MSVRSLMSLLQIRCHSEKKNTKKRQHGNKTIERKQLCHYNENLSDNLCENVKSLRQVQPGKSDSLVHCKRPETR